LVSVSSFSTVVGEVTPINPTFAIDTLLSRVPKESPTASTSHADSASLGKPAPARKRQRMSAAAAHARRRVSAELKHAHVKLHLLRAFAAQENTRDRWSALARDGTLASALRDSRQRFAEVEDDSDLEKVEMLEMLETAELESLR
jgi:hypothetical protein